MSDSELLSCTLSASPFLALTLHLAHGMFWLSSTTFFLFVKKLRLFVLLFLVTQIIPVPCNS